MNTVQALRVGFDDDNDLVFICDTQTDKFYLVVTLQDHKNLGWKEVKAILSCMELMATGTELSAQHFNLQAISFGLLHQRVNGPQRMDDGRLAAAIMPARSTFNVTHSDMITQTALVFKGQDNAFYFISTTNNKCVYQVKLSLSLPSQGHMSKDDCILFQNFLNVLEPGDRVPEALFLSAVKMLNDKVSHTANATAQMDSDTKIIKVEFKPPQTSDTSILSALNRLVQEMGRVHISDVSSNLTDADPVEISEIHSIPTSQRSQGETASELNKNSTQDSTREDDAVTSNSEPSSSSVLEDSPYPGITYTRALKKSGQAQVYEARREGSERTHAVKVFLDGEEQVSSYKAELRGLLGMSAHPNVVRVVDFFERPKPALVMEFIQGQDLSEYLSENGSMSQEEGLRMCIGIASGLVHMHENKIIHRDLKSANILRKNSDGKPVIIDLGLSGGRNELVNQTALFSQAPFTRRPEGESRAASGRRADPTQFQTQNIKGTPSWMAPEMITSRTWSDRTDVYAFGIIMWEVFSGDVPFVSDAPPDLTLTGLLVRISNGWRPSMSRIRGDLDTWVKNLMKECWQSDPKDRPSMKEVLHRLQKSDPEVLFRSLDTEKRGHLSFVQFSGFLENYMNGRVKPENMYSTFQKADQNGSGNIDIHEFKQFMESSSDT